MSRKVLDRYIVGSKSLSIYPANRAVFVETATGFGLNGIEDNQIVIYNADTGVSVGPGVTVATTPNLVIAQGIDTDGDGVADVLRKSAFNFISGEKLSAVTAEGPACGQLKIVDIGIGCVTPGKSYSLTIEQRTDHTERFYNYRDYERFTETVEFGYDACDDCDQTLDCKQVACALANKFNGTDRKLSIVKNGSLIRRVREHQDSDRAFNVYVLHANDYEFCFATADAACVGCNTIDAITGIIVDGVQTDFQLTTDPSDAEKSKVGQVPRILKMINEALGDKGTAISAETFTGPGKPCCDGVKILINACVTVDLLGFEEASITPCATGLPTYTVDTQGHCGGCDTVTTVTPCAYLRVVAKPIEIPKFCDRPDSFLKTLYTDIRVSTSYNHNNFGFFREFVKQDFSIPKNFVYEAIHKVIAQDTSANEPFSYGYNDFVGANHNILPGSRISAMLHGLFNGCSSFDSLCVYNFEHAMVSKGLAASGPMEEPKGRTTVLIPSSNTAARTAFEAIVNPWIVSAPYKLLQTVTCSTDQDQIERVLNPDTTVLTAEYPNANGKIIGN
jgi:hypothetical protein